MFVCGMVVGVLVVAFGLIVIGVVMGGDRYE